jgi:hemolysin activation/secretion protein
MESDSQPGFDIAQSVLRSLTAAGDRWREGHRCGRVADVRPNFVTLELGRVTPLPKGLSLKSEVSVLASSKPLPDTERIGLGGIHAVRGYVTEDGAVQQAMILRTSLYGSMPSMPAWMPGTLAPFLLADVGWGRDLFSRRDSTLSSLGAGFDFAAGSTFNSKLLAPGR